MVVGEMLEQIEAFKAQIDAMQSQINQDGNQNAQQLQALLQMQQDMLATMNMVASRSAEVKTEAEKTNEKMFLKTGGLVIPKLTTVNHGRIHSRIAAWTTYIASVEKFFCGSYGAGRELFMTLKTSVSEQYVTWLNLPPEQRCEIGIGNIRVPSHLNENDVMFLSRTIGDVIANGPASLVIKTTGYGAHHAFRQWVSWLSLIRRGLDIAVRDDWNNLCKFIADPTLNKGKLIVCLDEWKFVIEQVENFGALFDPPVESLNVWTVADGVVNLAEQVLNMGGIPDHWKHNIRDRLYHTKSYGFSPDFDDMMGTWSQLKEACASIKEALDDKPNKGVCQDFLRGKCTFGARCKFRHPEMPEDVSKSVAALLAANPGTPTPAPGLHRENNELHCGPWQVSGECKIPNCPYKHDESMRKKNAAKGCKDFKSGSCRFGERCAFSHDASAFVSKMGGGNDDRRISQEEMDRIEEEVEKSIMEKYGDDEEDVSGCVAQVEELLSSLGNDEIIDASAVMFSPTAVAQAFLEWWVDSCCNSGVLGDEQDPCLVKVLSQTVGLRSSRGVGQVPRCIIRIPGFGIALGIFSKGSPRLLPQAWVAKVLGMLWDGTTCKLLRNPGDAFRLRVVDDIPRLQIIGQPEYATKRLIVSANSFKNKSANSF